MMSDHKRREWVLAWIPGILNADGKGSIEPPMTIIGSGPGLIAGERARVIEYSAYEAVVRERDAQALCTISSENALAARSQELVKANRKVEELFDSWQSCLKQLVTERERSQKLAEAIREHIECEPGMYGNECVGLGGADGLRTALAEHEAGEQ